MSTPIPEACESLTTTSTAIAAAAASQGFLTAPTAAATVTPRATMGMPEFEELTTAEKLSSSSSDAGYRALVYRAYPNEPSCACPAIASDKAKTNKRQQQQQSSSCCPSGSMGRCCNRLRAGGGQDAVASVAATAANDPKKRGRMKLEFMPTHCAATTTTTTTATGTDTVAAAAAKNDEKQRRRKSSRMRGGGGATISGEPGLFSADSDFTWYNTRFTVPTRLEGGGCGAQQAYPAVGCGKAATGKQKSNGFQNNFDNSYIQMNSINPEYLALNKCKLRNVEEKCGTKPECSCPAKDNLESMLKKKGQPMCRKKPCMGTDCLIKAFKDAQEFVDSIGKVPGLAGLGITESPYFGQPQEPRETKKCDSKAAPAGKQPDNISTLCSIQNTDNLRKSNYNEMSTILASGSTKKHGVVQEGLTSFPDPSAHASLKSKKKDEKLEKPKETESSLPIAVQDTPCGEPKCKSRPKKVSMAGADTTDKEESAQKPSGGGQKSVKKQSAKGRSQSVPSERSSTKAKKFDYSYGGAYPQSVYGHKTCNLLRRRVPAHMGWIWNQYDPISKMKPRTGWRPGAISVTLKELLKEARDGFFKQVKRPMSLPRLGGKKGGKAQKTMSFTGMKKGAGENECEAEEEIEFPPTLHVHRKDGTYYVTMYPIRQDTSGVPRLDEPMNPLQFKIVKSKDSLASSSTASDMEIEFSPPAAVNRLRKKPNVVHTDTQVKQQDILDSFKRVSDPKKKNHHRNSKEKKEKDK